jgi:hypothetical protein
LLLLLNNQVWADNSTRIPLYLSLLLNPKHILTHTVNHFLHSDHAHRVTLSGALLPPSRQTLLSSSSSSTAASASSAVVSAAYAYAAADTGEEDGEVEGRDSKQPTAQERAKAEAAAQAAAQAAARAKAQAQANADSMDLLNTAICSVSGAYSFVDGVRVALTDTPAHAAPDVALSIWQYPELNTFALNTTHARPPPVLRSASAAPPTPSSSSAAGKGNGGQSVAPSLWRAPSSASNKDKDKAAAEGGVSSGIRYRFPLSEDERRRTLVRLYRDGVLMLAECIRQLASMVMLCCAVLCCAVLCCARLSGETEMVWCVARLCAGDESAAHGTSEAAPKGRRGPPQSHCRQQ